MDAVVADGAAWISILVAFVAYFIVSFLWWGPLFGKKWAVLMGMDPDEQPNMTLPLILQAVGTFLIAYVLWHSMEAFVATHGDGGIVLGELGYVDALTGAFFTWLGFFVPVQLGRVAWEKAPWALFGINAGGHLIGLVVMGLVFVWL